MQHQFAPKRSVSCLSNTSVWTNHKFANLSVFLWLFFQSFLFSYHFFYSFFCLYCFLFIGLSVFVHLFGQLFLFVFGFGFCLSFLSAFSVYLFCLNFLSVVILSVYVSLFLDVESAGKKLIAKIMQLMLCKHFYYSLTVIFVLVFWKMLLLYSGEKNTF